MDVVGGTAACAVAGGVVFSLIRPWFRVKVNCHFCNNNAKVSYSARNSWECGVCEQYNGFDEGGDYNKPIHNHNNSSYTVLSSSKKSRQNGLCKSCNLNQDLKISQLANFGGDGEALEEYRDHLERVYRLCGVCEEVVSCKLRDQDARLTPWIIQHRLETSRLNQTEVNVYPNPWIPFLVDIQFCFSIILFLLILSPDTSWVDLSALPHYIQDIVVSLRYSYNVHLHVIQMSCALMIALVSLPLLRVRPISILCFLPVVSSWFDYLSIIQLTLACVSGAVVLVGSNAPAKPSQPRRQRTVRDTISAKFIESDTEEEDTSGPGSTASQSSNQKLVAAPKRNNLLNSLRGELLESVGNLFSPSRMSSPLLRSGDANFLNHEFAIDNSDEKDCDLASLCLGEEEPERPASITSTASQSPFSPRLYSPENNSGIRFNSKSILRPSRLTSWVAGGYWTPPQDKHTEPGSRASSQSSGFVSGPASVLNYPASTMQFNPNMQLPLNPNMQLPLNQPMPVNFVSMPNSPANSFIGDDRFSLLSEPVHKQPGNPSGMFSQLGSAPGPVSAHPLKRSDNSPFTQIRPKEQSLLASRRNTLDDDMSDSSMDRLSQLGRRRHQRRVETSPSPSVTDKDRTLNEKLSLNITISLGDKLSKITISPLGVFVTLSVVANLVALYYFVTSKI